MEELGQVADERQANAVAASAAGAGFINPVEAVKNPWQMLWSNARSIVFESERPIVGLFFGGESDGCSFPRISDGIVGQIAEDAVE